MQMSRENQYLGKSVDVQVVRLGIYPGREYEGCQSYARADKTAWNELFAPEVQNGVLKYHSPKSTLLLCQGTIPHLFRVFLDPDSPNTVSMKRFPLFSTGN